MLPVPEFFSRMKGVFVKGLLRSAISSRSCAHTHSSEFRVRVEEDMACGNRGSTLGAEQQRQEGHAAVHGGMHRVPSR